MGGTRNARRGGNWQLVSARAEGEEAVGGLQNVLLRKPQLGKLLRSHLVQQLTLCEGYVLHNCVVIAVDIVGCQGSGVAAMAALTAVLEVTAVAPTGEKK